MSGIEALVKICNNPLEIIHYIRHCRLGCTLNIKMTDHFIRCDDFIAKHDGSIDFSINQKISVQELGKVSVFSNQDETVVPTTRNRTRFSRLQDWRANH